MAKKVNTKLALELQAEGPEDTKADAEKVKKALNILTTYTGRDQRTMTVVENGEVKELPTGTNGKAVLLEPQFDDLYDELQALKKEIAYKEVRILQIENKFRRAVGFHQYGILASRRAAVNRALVYQPEKIVSAFHYKACNFVNVPAVDVTNKAAS